MSGLSPSRPALLTESFDHAAQKCQQIFARLQKTALAFNLL